VLRLTRTGGDGVVGLADIERLRADALTVKWAERRQGGGRAYRPTQDLVARAQRLRDEGNYTTAIGRQLHGLLGHLWRDLGWCAHDAGDQDLARVHLNEGLNAATVAGDEQLAVFILNYMAQQANESGSGRAAVALARTARHEARHFGSDRLLSLLESQAARGHARENEPAEAHAAYAEAERLYQPHDPGRDPEWLAFWSPAAFQAVLAAGQIALGDFAAAEHAATASLAGIDRGRYPRDAASSSSWRALALVGQSEIDAAAACTVDTVALLDGIQSGRVTRRLRRLVPIFEARPTVPGVPEALAVLRSA
jgi:hypothetical protein